MSNEVLWVDKTGQEWKISEMGFSHLKNTINFIIRRIDKLQKVISALSFSNAFIQEYEFHYYDEDSEDYEKALSKTVDHLEKAKKLMETEFIARIMEGKN